MTWTVLGGQNLISVFFCCLVFIFLTRSKWMIKHSWFCSFWVLLGGKENFAINFGIHLNSRFPIFSCFKKVFFSTKTMLKTFSSSDYQKRERLPCFLSFFSFRRHQLTCDSKKIRQSRVCVCVSTCCQFHYFCRCQVLLFLILCSYLILFVIVVAFLNCFVFLFVLISHTNAISFTFRSIFKLNNL